MAGRAIVKSESGSRLRLALALAFVLPLAAFWWASAQAEPLRLAPPSVESAALITPPVDIPEQKQELAVSAPAAKTDRYNVVVLGDSLGDGMWAGLYHVLRQDKRFNVIKKSRVATGFSRQDYYDWNEAVREIAAETKIDIAVVVMGTNDRQPIVENGVRYALFDDNWREVYKRRVDDFTATLQATGARIYWLQLPVMRSPRFGADMASFNEIFEERALANGVDFVRTEGLASGADGSYTAYGEDRFGRTRLLRAEDGIHFTMAGYELLSGKVADAILADITEATAPRIATTAPVMLRAVEETTATPGEAKYDMADRRPGRSDDWLWLGATN
ncbi:protein of unknown function DUF459 [Parvibaculum lavamentivorans DS-1]|uniref:Uncharacterized protein n=1 Tax=Parvibaculum lavamentivorans (strain DS-1 / DSM 13023 / NCIMB 13966) TaxID=402881 RepID=A7HUI9_PARL1|nr:protein of unknown function DUF459 [Parvibaculum lavamentivorans DS-1]